MTDSKQCALCGATLTRITLPCPDGKEGCLVNHFRMECQQCALARLGNLDVRRADMRERLVKSIENNRAALRRLYESEAADFTPFMQHGEHALYVYLVRPETLRAVRTTTAVEDTVLFDWGADGKLVGIEVLLPVEPAEDVPLRAEEPDGSVPPGPACHSPLPGDQAGAGPDQGQAVG